MKALGVGLGAVALPRHRGASGPPSGAPRPGAARTAAALAEARGVRRLAGDPQPHRPPGPGRGGGARRPRSADAVIPSSPRPRWARSTGRAPEPVDVLIGRAGAAVARAAVAMLGGTYGRRVVVVAGKGNNGNDGRGRGPAAGPPGRAASGSSTRRRPRRRCPPPTWSSTPPTAPASGARYRPPDARRGHAGAGRRHPQRRRRAHRRGRRARPGRPTRTVTFAALKPGLLFEPGRSLAGAVDGGRHRARRGHAAGASWWRTADVAGWLPGASRRPPTSGSRRCGSWPAARAWPGRRAGRRRRPAGRRRLRAPQRPGGGCRRRAAMPVEVVQTELPADGWAATVLDRPRPLRRAGRRQRPGPRRRRPGPRSRAAVAAATVTDGGRRRRPHRPGRRPAAAARPPRDPHPPRRRVRPPGRRRRPGPTGIAAARAPGRPARLRGAAQGRARGGGPPRRPGAGGDHRRRPPGHRRHRRCAGRGDRRPGRGRGCRRGTRPPPERSCTVRPAP